MDEAEGQRGGRLDEIVKPVHEAGERSYADDPERGISGLRSRGHRLDATPAEPGRRVRRLRCRESAWRRAPARQSGPPLRSGYPAPWALRTPGRPESSA